MGGVKAVKIDKMFLDDDVGNEESVIFITDEERGNPMYIYQFDTIEEAYDELYKKISRLERIYRKKQKE